MVSSVKLFLEKKLSYKELKEKYAKACKQERARELFEQLMDDDECELIVITTEDRKYELIRLPSGALHVTLLTE